jgi:glycosyltransferase involved in cell wall biosynthesis
MTYSIVVSIYNDGYLAHDFTKEILRVFQSYLNAERISEKVELIFVNDGSKDDSIITLKSLLEKFDFVKVIDLSRNFGQHAAIACGLKQSIGEVVLRMNVDMQDPPYEIPKLLDLIKTGDYDLVVGQYAVRSSPLINRFTAYCYFATFKYLTGFETPQNTSPLRVMHRKFVNAYNSLTEKSRFPQGLDQWLGFRHKYVEIEHQARIDMRSSYNFYSRLKLAINGLLYFSDRPLMLVVITGLLFALIGVVLAITFILGKLVGINYVPGYISIVSLALIGLGLQLGCTGLVGLYVAKIFKEVQNRPLYIIREQYK